MATNLCLDLKVANLVITMVIVTMVTVAGQGYYSQDPYAYDPYSLMFGDAASRTKSKTLLNEMVNAIADPNQQEIARSEINNMPNTIIAKSLLSTVVNNSASAFRDRTDFRLNLLIEKVTALNSVVQTLVTQIGKLDSINSELIKISQSQNSIIEMLERKMADQARELEALKLQAQVQPPAPPPQRLQPQSSPHSPPRHLGIPRSRNPQQQPPQQPPQNPYVSNPYPYEGSGSEVKHGGYLDLNLGGAEVSNWGQSAVRHDGIRLNMGAGHSYNGQGNQKTDWTRHYGGPQAVAAAHYGGEDYD